MDDKQRQAIKQIIQEDQPRMLVEFAEREGEKLKDQGLTTSQIRSFFGQVRQIEAMWRIQDQRVEAERSFVLLKPRLAYQKQREKKTAELADILTAAVDAAVDKVERGSPELTVRFQRFVELFEAVLAYHKAAGGRD
jgi:CRISPR-associated protein Csm2